jgi:hypothetical protein
MEQIQGTQEKTSWVETKSLNSKINLQVLDPPPDIKRFIYLYFWANGPLLCWPRLMAMAQTLKPMEIPILRFHLDT